MPKHDDKHPTVISFLQTSICTHYRSKKSRPNLEFRENFVTFSDFLRISRKKHEKHIYKELSEKMVFSRHSVFHVGVAVGLRI